MRESMNDNFLKLQSRVIDSISKSNLIEIREVLASINEQTLVSGVGGSSVVSNFLAKVLERKNNIICESIAARDLKYKNLKGYKNIITCSYSGKNLGVDISCENNLDKYLLSQFKRIGVTNINYEIDDREYSFISLSSTLIPMSIILLYYCDDINLLIEILEDISNIEISNGNIYEILSGYETSTAAKFIESTMVESGIGIPIVHDKYDYCHGRSTLNYQFSNDLIFFDCDTELDKLYRIELNKYYKRIIKIDKKFDDDIINDFYFTYVSMFLCKKIAEFKKKGLSLVDYSPLVKKLYRFKGEV